MIGMLFNSAPYILVSMIAFGVFGWCSGRVFTDKAGIGSEGIPEILGSGITVNILIFNILAAAGSLFGMKLWISSLLWIVCELTLAVYAVRKTGSGIFRVKRDKALAGVKEGAETEGSLTVPGMTLRASVIVLILLQVFGTYMYASEAPEVMITAQNAMKAADTGRVVPGAPMMTMWAAVSRLLLRSPVIVIFSVSQFVMIPAFYLVFMMLARALTDKKDEQWFMMFCFCVLNLWGYQSKYLLPYTMLYCWFTGGTFVLYGLLPLVLWIILKKYRSIALLFSGNKKITDDPGYESPGRSGDGAEEINDYYSEEDEDMKNHRIVNARTVAIALLIVVIMLVGSVFILNRKINSLYDATVNLQKQVNDGARIYEFVPSDSQETAAYILRHADGSVTVMGSGNASVGEELYDFITGFSSEVNAWYLKSDREEDSGAYDKCVKMGLEVKHTYYINMEEKK